MFYWQLLIPKFLMNSWPSEKQSMKISRALRIMEDIVVEAKTKGVRAEQDYNPKDNI